MNVFKGVRVRKKTKTLEIFRTENTRAPEPRTRNAMLEQSEIIMVKYSTHTLFVLFVPVGSVAHTKRLYLGINGI